MEKVKGFVYLDDYKMYSLSSQIFEGITEYVVSAEGNLTGGTESQKGPVGSGKVLADIIAREVTTQEKKYFHDYSYTLFEKRLLAEGVVLEIHESAEFEDTDKKLRDFPFVKVKGKAVFNDVVSLREMLKNFNNIGRAIAHASCFADMQLIKDELEDAIGSHRDRNQAAKLKKRVKSQLNVQEIAKSRGLYLEEEMLKDLALLLEYGFQDRFEMQIPTIERVFSANLKREMLRESEALLVRRYSRYTQKEFVIFGMITQNGPTPELDSAEEELAESATIKHALMKMVGKLADVESAFLGCQENEVMIDPIAVYREF